MTHLNRIAVLLAAVGGAISAAPADDLRISGPYTHENLSVYLLHKSGRPASSNLLTLGEAIAKKKAAVYETGNVQQLAIENLSDQPVFVQAGDIVKGGRQDRVLTTDLLLQPQSGKLPIASFCVEQGRWTRRGAEPADQFHAAAAAVPTRALKQAVREAGNQSKVWSEVAQARVRLAGAVGGAVAAPEATSMQMALDDGKVAKAVDAYVAALSKIAVAGDAVGLAYAVNGKFSGADVYGTPDLFLRMWPKLLHASAAEALAERTQAGKFSPPEAAAIRKALAEGDKAQPGPARSSGPLSVSKRQSDGSVVYETTDPKADALLHKSYIAR